MGSQPHEASGQALQLWRLFRAYLFLGKKKLPGQINISRLGAFLSLRHGQSSTSFVSYHRSFNSLIRLLAKTTAAMAQMPQATVDTLAAAVYETCLKAPSDQLFSIAELQNMVPGKPSLEATQRVLNELLRTRSLSALTQGNQTVFKAAPKDYADKYMSPLNCCIFMF